MAAIAVSFRILVSTTAFVGLIGFASQPSAFASKRSSPRGSESSIERNSESIALSPLYTRLGGAVAIRSVVSDWVERLVANPRVDLFRKGRLKPADKDKLKKSIFDFLGSVSGGPQKYKGQDLMTVQTQSRLSEIEFTEAVGELESALDARGIAGRERAEVLVIVTSVRRALFAADTKR